MDGWTAAVVLKSCEFSSYLNAVFDHLYEPPLLLLQLPQLQIEFLPIAYQHWHFVSEKNASGVSPAMHECSETACKCDLRQLVDLSAPPSHHSGP